MATASDEPHLAPVPGRVPPFEGPCRWLIALDYDGTLRRDEGAPVPPSFLALMAELRPHGVRWGINTGRAMPYLLGEILPLMPALPDFLCTCERYVHMADAQGRLRAARLHNRRCLADNLGLRARILPTMQGAMGQLRREHPEWVWEYAADDPLSIEADTPETMERMLPHFRALAERLPGADIQRAGRYLRFCDARHSKGSALHYLARMWRVPEERLVIMGDGHNDLDAFKRFPRAFRAAPAGAHPEVIEHLRTHGGYVSPEVGVEEALRLWSVQVARQARRLLPFPRFRKIIDKRLENT